eukprot:TRINITY_DN93659_c0_g1_i1.p1 TRINITY_DN93659_c0_g1~~TRINITY_DN93659_c0_g1_i1.p1  ORF type:complete len:686 (+),score=185.05 TRINITY_DN93659_c0_g1_i1:58-2115(+)
MKLSGQSAVVPAAILAALLCFLVEPTWGVKVRSSKIGLSPLLSGLAVDDITDVTECGVAKSIKIPKGAMKMAVTMTGGDGGMTDSGTAGGRRCGAGYGGQAFGIIDLKKEKITGVLQVTAGCAGTDGKMATSSGAGGGGASAVTAAGKAVIVAAGGGGASGCGLVLSMGDGHGGAGGGETGLNGGRDPYLNVTKKGTFIEGQGATQTAGGKASLGSAGDAAGTDGTIDGAGGDCGLGTEGCSGGAGGAGYTKGGCGGKAPGTAGGGGGGAGYTGGGAGGFGTHGSGGGGGASFVASTVLEGVLTTGRASQVTSGFLPKKNGTVNIKFYFEDDDKDGVPNPKDSCKKDPEKAAPGLCGCGKPDRDSDGDGHLDCRDGCPHDSTKTAPGKCGCGKPDTDTDGDGTPDCQDKCPSNKLKTEPGLCGCFKFDIDSDKDGIPDCMKASYQRMELDADLAPCGKPHKFTVPKGSIKVEVQLSGGDGGLGSNGLQYCAAGMGARVNATVPLKDYDEITVIAACAGGAGFDRLGGGGGGASAILVNGKEMLIAAGGGGASGCGPEGAANQTNSDMFGEAAEGPNSGKGPSGKAGDVDGCRGSAGGKGHINGGCGGFEPAKSGGGGGGAGKKGGKAGRTSRKGSGGTGGKNFIDEIVNISSTAIGRDGKTQVIGPNMTAKGGIAKLKFIIGIPL